MATTGHAPDVPLTAAEAGNRVVRPQCLKATRAQRRNDGRDTVMTPAEITVARQLYDTGSHAIQEIADALGVGRATIYRHLGGADAGPP